MMVRSTRHHESSFTLTPAHSLEPKEPAMPSPATQGRWKPSAVALATLAAHVSTWAHEGHGLGGSHWHATDSWGVLAAAVLAALVFYRRK